MRRLLTYLAIFVVFGGGTYGLLTLVEPGDEDGGAPFAAAVAEGPAGPSPSSSPPMEPTADYDTDDPAYSLLGESEATDRMLIARAGRRADYRVPAALVAGLSDGPLAHAVNVRAFWEIEPGDAAYGRLNADQRAVYALTWADDEILNGGFWQFFYNDTGAVGADLVAAAQRVGAPDYEAVFRAAQALFAGGKIPRDHAARQRAIEAIPDDAYARVDDPYAALQYRRSTNLAVLLGAHVARHRAAFVAG